MRRHKFTVIIIATIVLLVVTGCSVNDITAYFGKPTAASNTAQVTLTGDPAHGDLLFHKGANDAPACSSCHAMTESAFAIGPALGGIALHAGERMPDITAEQYLRESITNPQAYIAGGFRPIMYADYALHYSDQDIADLVAYLKTLQ